jgi:hypothetical protein
MLKSVSNSIGVAISSKRWPPPPLANRRCVQDESIVVEHDEVNVFASHHFNRAAHRRITENRRTLLREPDEENLTEVRASSKDFSDNSQRDVKRRANPIDGRILKLNTGRKIHFRLDLAVAFRAMVRQSAVIVSAINYTVSGARDRLVMFR